jgi:hypothetical protein
MLSQCLFNRGAFAEAAHHAIEAIDLFYQVLMHIAPKSQFSPRVDVLTIMCILPNFAQWGTNWDKRIQYPQWVGFARMALLRAKRRQEGLSGLPHQDLSEEAQTKYDPAVTDRGKVTYLQDLLAEFEEHTEGHDQEVFEASEVNASGASGRSRL